MIIWALPGQTVWWVNLGIGAPLSLLVAAFSWHFVEKPALLLRRVIVPRALPPAPGVEAATPAVGVKAG